MQQQFVDLKEIEVAFQRFNRYADSLLKADYWGIKTKLSDLMAFCVNNRVISFIFDPIITNKTYYNKPLKELIIKDNRLDLGEDFNKYIIIFTILLETSEGNVDRIAEFCRVFGETNKNQAVYKFNSNIVKPFLVKITNDFQCLYNKLSLKNKIELSDIVIYEEYRIKDIKSDANIINSDSSYNNNKNDKIEENHFDAVEVHNDSHDDFQQLKDVIMQNPRISQDTKNVIINDINDIMEILGDNKADNRKVKIFNLINDIGLRSNWVIGKMDEKLSHPLISELVKIWALRQIGVRN